MRLRFAALFLCLLAVTSFAQTHMGGAGSGITIVGGSPLPNIQVPAQTLFPNTLVGNVATASVLVQTVTVAQATILSVSIPTGATSADFAETDNCPATMPGNSSCTITVTFTPAASGTRSANLVIVSDDPGSPDVSVLIGQGLTPTSPAATLSPTAVNFPDTTTGLTTASQSVTLTSSGTATLNISSITLGGTNSADFAQTNTCGATLAPAATCTISVTFSPTIVGAESAQLIVASDDPGSPDVTNLSGNGLAPINPLIINTTSLPDATISVAYSTTLAATGGTAPYTWSISTGSLTACVMTMSSAGVISGTPTTATSCSITVQLQDTVCTPGTDCPLRDLVMTVDNPSIAENAYCPANEIATTNGSSDEFAALLQNCVNTAMVNTPAKAYTAAGAVVSVQAGNATDLQNKLNTAQCGQHIVIPSQTSPGVQAVYSGTFTIPALVCTAGNWLWIEPDTLQTGGLPAEGNQISPSWAGQDWPRIQESYPKYLNAPHQGIYMPKVRDSGTGITLVVSSGAKYIRIIGLEITTNSGTDVNNLLISNGNTSHIIFDRLWFHGADSPIEHSTNVLHQGIVSNSSDHVAVINSRGTDFLCRTGAGGFCVEGQPLAGGNGTGGTAFKYFNNFLSAAGESFFAGGGNATGELFDVEVRHNHTYIPRFWVSLDPAYDGTGRTCKNTGELKTGDRVLEEGNIYEGSYGTCVDQNGYSVLVGPKNQALTFNGTANSDGAGNLTWVSGTHFSANEISALCATANHCHLHWSTDAGGTYPRKVQTFTDTSHINVSPAPAAGTGLGFIGCLPGGGPGIYQANITLRYNIMRQMRNGIQFSSVASDCGDLSLGISNVSIHDTIQDTFNGAAQTITGGCCTYNVSVAQVVGQTPGIANYVIKHNTWLPFALVGANPGIQYLLNFTNSTTNTVANAIFKDNIGAAGLHSSDPLSGKCNGMTGTTNLLNCEGGTTWCFAGNLLTGTSFPGFPSSGLQTPFPTSSPGGTGPGCSGPSTNFTVADYPSIGFVNLNGAIRGDYHLTVGSIGHNHATDGTDVGANIDLVNQYTQNVDIGQAPEIRRPATDTDPGAIAAMTQCVGTNAASAAMASGHDGAGLTTSSTLTAPANGNSFRLFSGFAAPALQSTYGDLTLRIKSSGTGSGTHAECLAYSLNSGSTWTINRCDPGFGWSNYVDTIEIPSNQNFANLRVAACAYNTTGGSSSMTINDIWTQGQPSNSVVDMLNWVLMPLPNRTVEHMFGALHKVSYMASNDDRFWWIKSLSGNPWDINKYDANFTYLWITENGDPGQVCSGFANCFIAPNAYKRYLIPVKFSPRYFDISAPATILSPAPNYIKRTVNCEADNQTLIDIGHIKTVTNPPVMTTFGSSVPSAMSIEVDYFYGGSGATYNSRERFWLVQGFGQIQWDVASWNGTTYVVNQTSQDLTETTGSVASPNFPCGATVPAPSWWF